MSKSDIHLTKFKHPNSRKTQSLMKKIKKSVTRDKNKTLQNIKQNLLGEKVVWFKDNLPNDSPTYEAKQIDELIEKHLGRFDEELEQIKLKHSIGSRKNRQHANREDIIELTRKREREEYTTCGFEIPDLTNVQNVTLLKKWNGELKYLQNIKLKRYSKSDLLKMSS